MEHVSRAHDWLINAMKVAAGVVIFGVFVVIVLDVGLTILAKWGLGIYPWDRTHGLVEYGLLWFTMLAAPWLARIKGHVYIDAVTVLLPPRVKRVTAKCAYVVALCGSTAMAVYSFDLLVEAFVIDQVDDRGADFLYWTLYLPMPFGFGFVAIEFLRYLFGFDDMYGDRTEVKDSM